MNPPDIDRITAMLEDVISEEVMPRFGRLHSAEIERKVTPGDPSDVVTVIDRLVEANVTRRLADLSPGVPILAEESAHASPERLRLVEADGPLWVLDPIDGTRNFAKGKSAFGVMLAWVFDGRTRAAWILLPALKHRFVAEEGGGTLRDGTRIQVPEPRPGAPPRGSLHLGYMTKEQASALRQATAADYRAAPSSGCAAVEYTEILEGKRGFSIYHRLYPWDHAPGALLVSEGGGRVEHLDGTPYTPRSSDQVTIVAGSPEIALGLRQQLE